MINAISSATTASLAKAGVVVAVFAVLAVPAYSQAATYAYVDRDGDVATIVAASWVEALQNAVDIAVHSGVLLLDSADDHEVVGDSVDGV